MIIAGLNQAEDLLAVRKAKKEFVGNVWRG